MSFTRYGSLKGKTVIITGGASGTGASFVRAFVENDAKVAFLDLQRETGAALALVAERTGRHIVIHSVSWASVYAMNARLADRYRVGRVFLADDAAHTIRRLAAKA